MRRSFLRLQSLAVLPLAAFVILAISACSSPLLGIGTFSVLPQLAKSMTAMRQVNTHFVIQATATTNTNQHVLPGLPTHQTVTITGNGDEALAQQGQEQMQLVVTPSSGTSMRIAQVYSQKHLYMQPGGQGQWFDVDTSSLPPMQGILHSLLPQHLDLGTLLTLAQHVQVIDEGNVTLAGKTLHQVSLTVDTAGLKQLLASSYPTTQAEQQVIAQLQQDVRAASGTLTVWIDEHTSLIDQAAFKGQLQIAVNAGVTVGGQTVQPFTLATALNARVSMSSSNQLVTITPPAQSLHVQLPALAVHAK